MHAHTTALRYLSIQLHFSGNCHNHMSSAPSDHSLISNYPFQQHWCQQKQPLPPAPCHVFLLSGHLLSPSTAATQSDRSGGKVMNKKEGKVPLDAVQSPWAPQMAVLVQLRGWQGAAYASTALSGNTCQISPSGSNCVCTKTSEKSAPLCPVCWTLAWEHGSGRDPWGCPSPLPHSCRQEPAQQIQPGLLQQGSCQVNTAQLQDLVNVRAGAKRKFLKFPLFTYHLNQFW